MTNLTSRLALLAGFTVLAGLAATVAPAAAQARLAALAVSRPDLSDLGAAPAATPVTLAITLKYRDKAALDALVLRQGTPGSPDFHRFLTPAQFAARFGPTQADHDAVVAALRKAGFSILRTYPNRTVIDAAAPAGVAGAYFQTAFHLFDQAGHGQRYGNVTAATLPEDISAQVETVAGLDNIVRRRPQNRPAQYFLSGAGQVVKSKAQPIERLGSRGQFEGIYPAGLAAAYGYPKVSGAGHAIAIVIDSDIANASLSTFWKAAGVTRAGAFNRVLVNGTNPGINGDEGETAIDTETTSSLAPGAAIDLYLISSLADAPIEDAYNLAVTNNDMDAVSSSFGGCELDDTPFNTATDKIAEQGVAIGITFTASSGDAGGDCEDQTASGSVYYNPDIVNSPASGPHFLAVGGTTLTINATTGARVSETAWSPGGSSGGGGGGVSSFWALPSYQSGVTGMAVVPTIKVKAPESQPKGGFAGRNVPDISMDASNATGSYIAVYAGGWTGYGGTSVANPVFAALVALQDAVTGSLSGYVNPTLYATFTGDGAKPGGVYGVDFLDVTSGSIGGTVNGVGVSWSAKAGYDQATGIGTILGGAY
jgi:kumamolisin